MVGFGTGAAATTGGNNIFLGYAAGDAVSTGGTNILIGYDVDAQSATASSQLSIGNVIFGTGGFGTGTTVGAGNIGIGIAAPSYRLHASITTTGDVAGFTNSSGTCTINPTGTALSCSSDATLKRDIVPLSSVDSLDALDRLRPVSFRWKNGADTDPVRIGLIAQEVETVLPGLVTIGPDGKKAVNYLGLMPYALSAIQEQQKRLATFSEGLSILTLKTDANITTLGELQSSVDTQLTLIGDTLAALDKRTSSGNDSTVGRFAAFDGHILSLENNLTALVSESGNQGSHIVALESDMATLKAEHLALMDFYSTFSLGNAVMKDGDNNVDLLGGRLTAKVIDTGELVIGIRDSDAPTVGTATLYPAAKDRDADGKDDFSGLPMSDPSVISRDGKSTTIRTKAVSKTSRIFITPDVAEPIAVTERNNGKDFTVSTGDAVSEEIRFDWMIITERAGTGEQSEAPGGF
jgi:hypothetical protein